MKFSVTVEIDGRSLDWLLSYRPKNKGEYLSQHRIAHLLLELQQVFPKKEYCFGSAAERRKVEPFSPPTYTIKDSLIIENER